jgi:hypothetical protein
MKKILKSFAVLTASLLLLQGCADLDIAPRNAVPTATAINNLASARAAVLGAYSEMQDGTLAFDGWLSNAQMFCDEMIHTGTFPTRLEFGQLNVFPANTTMGAVFSDFYDVINICNNIIEVLPGVVDATLSDADKNALLGEAHFMRAFCYWYLTNNWTDVPLVLTPTVEVGDNLNVPVNTRAEIMTQIKMDLDFAEANAPAGGGDRVGADAATAMLARWYLFNGDNANALAKAEELIDGGAYALEADYASIFAGGTSERIFYLSFNSIDANSNAFFYFPSAKGGRLSTSPSSKLIEAYEVGDARLAASIDSSSVPGEPHLIKYSDVAAGTDPIYFIRYAEVLLIAAEAAAAEGDFTKANDFYNQVRTRAGLAENTLDASNYVDLILQERFVEFAGEGSNRLWDLRRTGKAQTELAPFGYDGPCDDVWPLPQRDLDRNPNLVQNGCCNC